LKAVF
jgi:hypothetical protein